LVDHQGLRGELRASVATGGIHLFIAPPGAGKSWELTNLADELSQAHIVARHYCFLDPGDDLVERRVTTDVFFGNLIAELNEVMPERKSEAKRYFADMTILENLLKCEGEQRKIFLLIDGLDHIARVKSFSSSLSDNETDIVEQLATLSFPSNVTIILGSQPGEHLNPLFARREGDVIRHDLPKWEPEEILSLTNRLGVEPS